MAKRFTDGDIWSKDWFLDLSIKQKLLIKFLFDNCDCAGFYEISYRTLRNCFNEEIRKEDFQDLKQIKFIDDKTIFIEDFIKYQYNCEISELNPKFSVHRGILKKLNKYGIFGTLTKELPNPTYEGLQDKDKDKDIDIDTKLYGEYLNVNLSKEQYGKLLAMCASQKMLNELINSFSVNIEVGKERPYTAELPNAHYERLKSYYNYRRKNPDSFIDKTQIKRPEYLERKKEKVVITQEDEKQIEDIQKNLREKLFGR